MERLTVCRLIVSPEGSSRKLGGACRLPIGPSFAQAITSNRRHNRTHTYVVRQAKTVSNSTIFERRARGLHSHRRPAPHDRADFGRAAPVRSCAEHYCGRCWERNSLTDFGGCSFLSLLHHEAGRTELFFE